MANQLKMAIVQAILTLHQRGWSNRRIAQELGVHRETVGRYIRLAEANPKPANAPTGSDSKPAIAPLGSIPHLDPPKPAIAPLGSAVPPETAAGGKARRKSICESLRAVIVAAVEAGLSARRIYQDLVTEHQFAGSYWSVRRFVRQLDPEGALPFRRMECAAGEEAQVDFGCGAAIETLEGKRRRPHVFRIVLSHSRKGYSEAVYRQTTEDFIRALENAFWHFGGVPRVVVIDNLKAAVPEADWYDPTIHPKVQSFCEHYGVVIRPTRPYTPRHKGKIERGIDYVKDNALKGRSFTSLEQENQHLQTWEASVADTRVHGTTRRQVGKLFEEAERPALQPLPHDRFPLFREAQRSVHRDGHVEVDKAYYSVPPEYLGRRVWARWDSRLVRVFNSRFEQIALHVKHEPGRFSTQSEHIASKKRSSIERGAAWLLAKASRIGPETARWAEAMLEARGVEGMRVLVGLTSLAARHRGEAIEQACQAARRHGAYRLRVIRQLLKRQAPPEQQLEFLESHPIIRSLSEYAQRVPNALWGRDQRPQFPPPDPHPLPSSLLAGEP